MKYPEIISSPWVSKILQDNIKTVLERQPSTEKGLRMYTGIYDWQVKVRKTILGQQVWHLRLDSLLSKEKFLDRIWFWLTWGYYEKTGHLKKMEGKDSIPC